jgi:hypothetical protein
VRRIENAVEKFLLWQPYIWSDEKFPGHSREFDVSITRRKYGWSAGGWAVVFLILATVNAIVGDIGSAWVNVAISIGWTLIGVRDRRRYMKTIREVRFMQACIVCFAPPRSACLPICPNVKERTP